jgi:hypothetical protein
MKKIAYQTPEVKVKTLFMESLMAGSGVSASDQGIEYGGVDENGEKEVDAKNFGNHSVWDD